MNFKKLTAILFVTASLVLVSTLVHAKRLDPTYTAQLISFTTAIPVLFCSIMLALHTQIAYENTGDFKQNLHLAYVSVASNMVEVFIAATLLSSFSIKLKISQAILGFLNIITTSMATCPASSECRDAPAYIPFYASWYATRFVNGIFMFMYWKKGTY